MRRLLLILLVGVAAVLAVVYGVRLAQRRTSTSVAGLLPRATVAFAHLPDFNGMVDDWHRSDIYQIYREPAVHDFLQKPISQSGKTATVSDRIGELKQLEAKDAFVAVTSMADDKPKLVGGFRYRDR